MLRVEVHIHVYVPTCTLHVLNYPERKPIGRKGLRHTMLCLIEAFDIIIIHGRWLHVQMYLYDQYWLLGVYFVLS